MKIEGSRCEQKSHFSTGTNKCLWNYDLLSKTTGTCSFINPNQDIIVILFVAVFCAIISTPLAISADWIIINILAARTGTKRIAIENKLIANGLLNQTNILTYKQDL